MLLEVDEETRDFVTIYNKDFPEKKIRRVIGKSRCSNFGASNYEQNLLKTVYQTDYSDDYISLYKQRTGGTLSTKLPDNWVIPETSYKKNYRNLRDLLGEDRMDRQQPIRPANSLDPNMKQREILKVTTGNSEYVMSIGVLGDRIFKEKLRRDIEPIGRTYNPQIDCSNISENSNFRYISKVF